MTLTNTPSIGFIGFGKMATAIWQGAQLLPSVKKNNVVFYRRNKEESAKIQTQFPHLQYTSLKQVCQQDVLIFAVKPQQIQKVLNTLPTCQPQCVISILAGTSISNFESHFKPNTPIIRTMPNMPCLIQMGMTAITYNKDVSSEQKKWIETLFATLGQITVVPEKQMNIITGISGSGPGFLYEIADMIAEIGRKNGLNDKLCIQLIAQTMIGAGQTLLKSEQGPHQLIKEICSPGGTTITGLAALRESQAKKGIQAMITTAIQRAKDLSN